MKTVALVPIKLNNERLPGKNLKALSDGVPLLRRLLRTLSKVASLDEVVVFCSDESIRSLVEEEGARFLARSTSLDTAETKSNDILAAFTSTVPADVYVLTHATSPFLSASSVEEGLSSVVDGTHDSALSVEEVRNFYWTDGQPANYEPAAIPRTQDLAPIYMETSAFFVFHKDVFAELGRRVGLRPKLVSVSRIEAIDIDDPVDFAIADAVLTAGLVPTASEAGA